MSKFSPVASIYLQSMLSPRRLMHIWLLAASIMPLLFACQERNATTQAERLKSLTAEMLDLDSGVWYASHMVAFSPSPQVALSLMADTALPFEAELIWTTDAKEIGNDAPASSFGLGAVSADFMYCAYYGEKQACGDLLRTLGSVAETLGLVATLTPSQLDSLRTQWGSTQGPPPRLAPLLLRASQQLCDRGHPELYAIMSTAGWLESTRLLANLAYKHPNPRLRRLVAEQRFTLKGILELLAGYVYRVPLAAKLYAQLSALNELYLGVQIAYDYAPSEVDTAAHLTTLHGTMRIAMSTQQLQAIVQQLNGIMDGERSS